ncbi:hypothetical protein EDC62_1360 [Tibeticola sediminis]|uniref:Uncharacterized protein n=1 Tax=Tibeticola sediminis TaxID=1917811 RepID=A0A3N4VAM5_9BURK|nr:hypothetical protein [Tibeticola sediminis]RPE70870.1 hypothetical protein EDC62_1360 [Tibeticola sediminis]
MKGIFELVGVLVALAVLGLVVKKQLAAHDRVVPAAVVAPASDASSAVTVREQARQTQQQVRQQVESLMQQPRPMPEGQ